VWGRRRAGVVVGLVALAGVGCGCAPPSAAPSVVAARPAIRIAQEWTATNGQWTFTGQVDPEGDPTDVVLEVGPGPANARRFDARIPVEQGRTTAGSLTVTTREIPDIPEICVRFTATNTGGTSSSSPVCFPHDLPTKTAPGVPTVDIDPKWTAVDGEWTFSARVNPSGGATDVVLELGPGPASAGTFPTKVSAAEEMTEAAKLTITTRAVPDVDEVCVRFTATNSLGTTSSPPLCFEHDASGPSASP
jgi:hypothetical protein